MTGSFCSSNLAKSLINCLGFLCKNFLSIHDIFEFNCHLPEKTLSRGIRLTNALASGEQHVLHNGTAEKDIKGEEKG